MHMERSTWKWRGLNEGTIKHVWKMIKVILGKERWKKYFKKKKQHVQRLWGLESHDVFKELKKALVWIEAEGVWFNKTTHRSRVLSFIKSNGKSMGGFNQDINLTWFCFEDYSSCNVEKFGERININVRKLVSLEGSPVEKWWELALDLWWMKIFQEVWNIFRKLK